MELQHAWLKKGEQAEDHKYIRREWRNNRWVYYYDTDLKNQLGYNYRSTSEIEAERKAKEEQRRVQQEKQKVKDDKIKAAASVAVNIIEFVATGREWVDSRLSQKVVDVIRGDADPLDWSEANERAKRKLGIKEP